MSYYTPQGDVVGYDKQGLPIFGPDAVQPSSSGSGGSFITRIIASGKPRPAPAAAQTAGGGGILSSIANALSAGASALVSAVTPRPAQLVTPTSRTPAWVVPGALIAAGLGGIWLLTRKRKNPARRVRGSKFARRSRAAVRGHARKRIKRIRRHTKASKRLSMQAGRRLKRPRRR